MAESGFGRRIIEPLKKVFTKDTPEAQAQPAPKPRPKPDPIFEKGVEALRRKNVEREEALKEYKKGGMVKKTGPAKLHKGERVLTVKQTKAFNKSALPQTRTAAPCKVSKKK